VTRIVVFGPGGMVGSRIVTELQDRGEPVTGASRSSGVDVSDSEQVAEAVRGADVVICAVSARGVEYTLADVARALIEGMRRAGARRLIVVGGAGSLLLGDGTRLMDSPDFPGAYRAEAAQAAEALEVFRAVGDLAWTYVSPAAEIHPGERTGRYRLGGDRLIAGAQGTSEISAEDFAIAIADLADSGAHAGERVTAAW
jgi:putative NADH-flavin reductase